MGLDSDEINRFRRSSTDDEIKELMAACSPGGLSWASDDSLTDPALLKDLADMTGEEEEDPEEVDAVMEAATAEGRPSSKPSLHPPPGPTSDELMESLGLQDEDYGQTAAVVEAADPHACALLVSVSVMEWYLGRRGDGPPLPLTDEEKEEIDLQLRTFTLDVQSGRLSSEGYAERVKARIDADEALLEHLDSSDRIIVKRRIDIAMDELKSKDEEEEEDEERYEEHRTVVLRRMRAYQKAAGALAAAGLTQRARDLLHSAVNLKDILDGGAKQCRIAIKEGRVPPSLTDEVIMGQSEVDRRAVLDQLQHRLQEASKGHKDHALFCLRLSQSPDLLDPPPHGQVLRRLAGKPKPGEAEMMIKLKDEAVKHNSLRKDAEREITWLEEAKTDRWQFVPNELEKRSVKFTRLNENEEVEAMGHMRISFEIPPETMAILRGWSEGYPMHCEVTILGLPSAADPHVFTMGLSDGTALEHDFDFSHMRQTSIERAFGKAKMTMKVFRQRNALASLFGNSCKEIGDTPVGLRLEPLQTRTNLDGELTLSHVHHGEDSTKRRKPPSVPRPVVKVRCRLRAPADRASWLTMDEYAYCVLPTPLPPTIKGYAEGNGDEEKEEEEGPEEAHGGVVDPLVSPLDPSLWVSVEALEDRLEVVSDDEERGGLEARRDMLVEKIQSGAISFDDYVESMKKNAESDIKLAIELKRLNRTHEAAVVYKRAKVMRDALKADAEADAEADDDDDAEGG